jgi:hypothetical protein
MTTVLVDISEKDLINFLTIDNLNLEGFNEEGRKNLLKEYPFTLYQNRMIGSFITIQISLHGFLLFKGFNLIK